MRARAHHRGFQGEELLEKNEEVRLQVLFDHGPDLLQRLRVHDVAHREAREQRSRLRQGPRPHPRRGLRE